MHFLDRQSIKYFVDVTYDPMWLNYPNNFQISEFPSGFNYH